MSKNQFFSFPFTVNKKMPTRTASSLRVSRQSTLGTLKVPWNKPKSKGVAVRLFLLFPAFPPMRMYTLCHSLYYTTDFHVSAWRNVRALYIPPPCSADRMLTSTEIQHNSFFLCVLFFKICIHARSTYAKKKNHCEAQGFALLLVFVS